MGYEQQREYVNNEFGNRTRGKKMNRKLQRKILKDLWVEAKLKYPN